MARMLTQVPLPLLPRDAAEIAPGVGVVAGPDGGGVVWVHGLATFAWDAGDEAARRLAAVQLVQNEYDAGGTELVIDLDQEKRKYSEVL